MKVKEEINEILTFLGREKGVVVSAYDVDLFAEGQEDDAQQPIVLKVLSILGGVIAMIALAIFLYLLHLHESTAGLITVGLACIIASVVVGREIKRLLLDTFAISIFVLGFVILLFAFDRLQWSDTLSNLTCACIALSCGILIRRQILILVSLFIANVSLLGCIFSIPAYSYEFGMIYCAILGIGLVLLCIFEGKLISTNALLQRMYQPAVHVLMVVFLIAIAYLDVATVEQHVNVARWISILVLLISYLILLYRVVSIVELDQWFHRFVVFFLGLIMFLPGLVTYGVSASLLVVLAGFLFSQRLFLVLGLAAYLYFMSRFYYTIQFSLLEKSVMLMVSGLLLLAVYCKIYYKRLSDGKN